MVAFAEYRLKFVPFSQKVGPRGKGLPGPALCTWSSARFAVIHSPFIHNPTKLDAS